MNKQDGNKHRQHPLEINLEDGVARNLVALARIDFGKEFLLPPAVTAGAENHDEHAAKRKHGVTHDKVFEVQHTAAGAERFKARKHVEAEGARERKREYDQDVPEGDPFTVVPLEVHPERDEILEHGNQGGQSRERHEQEERRTAEPTRRHHGKHVGKRNEDETRALSRRLAKGEAARDDDNTRNKRDDRIKDADTRSFLDEGVLAAYVATENRHATDTDTEREERMRECRKDCLAHALARLRQALERRKQIELETCSRTRKRHGSNGKEDHDDKQANHHLLGDALDTFLEPERYNPEAEHDGDGHPENHKRGVRKHFAEARCNLVRGSLEEVCVGDHLVEVIEHPARDHRVERHQYVVRRNQRELGPVPLGARLFQVIEGTGDTATAATTQREFCHENREPQEKQEAKIGQHKSRTTVLACNIGETPDVAQPDGATGSDKDKTKS